VAYYTKNPQSKAALEDWYEKTKEAEWKCFADIKQTFNSVDSVGTSDMCSTSRETIIGWWC